MEILSIEEAAWKVRNGQVIAYPTETVYGLGSIIFEEEAGDVPDVTFPCASLHDPETGRIAVYYGCADTVTGLCFGYIPEIIDFVKRTNIL